MRRYIGSHKSANNYGPNPIRANHEIFSAERTELFVELLFYPWIALIGTPKRTIRFAKTHNFFSAKLALHP